MYLPPTSGVESFHGKRLLPSKLCILENRPKWLLVVTFGGLQRVGLLRVRENMVYWCMPLFLLCFLSSFYHFLSFFPFLRSFFLSFFFLLLFLLWVSLLSVFTTFFPWVFLLSTFSASPRCFSPFHLCLPPLFIVGWFHEISPFYPYSFIHCFWFVVDIPSRLPTHPLAVRPLPLLGKLSAFSFFHYPFHDKISLCFFLLYTSTSRFKWIRIKLPHHLPLWHASDGPSHLWPLLGKIPSQKGIFP